MPRPSRPCPLCGAPLEIEGLVSRKDTCPSCRRDLHACHACRFYDERAHNRCREPKADWQPRADKANFCDFFELASEGPAAGESADREATRRRQLDDLFKNF